MNYVPHVGTKPNKLAIKPQLCIWILGSEFHKYNLNFLGCRVIFILCITALLRKWVFIRLLKLEINVKHIFLLALSKTGP